MIALKITTILMAIFTLVLAWLLDKRMSIGTPSLKRKVLACCVYILALFPAVFTAVAFSLVFIMSEQLSTTPYIVTQIVRTNLGQFLLTALETALTALPLVTIVGLAPLFGARLAELTARCFRT